VNPDQKHAPQASQRIQPAKVSLSRDSSTAGARADSRSRAAVRFAWVGLLALAVTAGTVFFVLPGRIAPVTPADVPPGGAVPLAQPAPGPALQPQPPGASPWSQAQLAKLRKDTQDILGQMLEAQKQLQDLSIEAWGAGGYGAAIKLAEAGDAAYRTQDYGAAKSQYQQALDKFESLLVESETVYAKSVSAGYEAIGSGHSAAALKAFATALLIRPNDADALKGERRAASLDQVLALIAQGDALMTDDRLVEARAQYRKALDLDAETEIARRQSERIEGILLEREFKAAMSKGYRALEAGDAVAARKAFARADKLKPGAAEARSALQESQQRITSARIRELLERASGQESSEQWHEAVASYDQALALDANLLAARQGRQHAAGRAQLNERLSQAIARPDRLNDAAVRAEASALLQQAVGVRDPGPGLKKQIVVLDSLLKQAATPAAVEIRSDNETEVVVYKVGSLGRFESRQLTLLPGNYVAVGSRPGYRDVRVEFTVQSDKPTLPVIVQCEEKIALGS